jgi:hypothetical protein
MAEDQIRYDVMTQNALRGVVRSVLEQIDRTGLPGEHHLYIAFDTHGPGVSVSSRLKQQYPEEMTIVLQHQFWDMVVTHDRFEVKLSFNNIPERLVIPFTQIKAFYDPSVQFGLQFGGHGAANDAERAISDADADTNHGAGLPGLLERADDSEDVAAVADATGGKSSPAPGAHAGGDNDTHSGPAAEVVELDAFRKK